MPPTERVTLIWLTSELVLLVLNLSSELKGWKSVFYGTNIKKGKSGKDWALLTEAHAARVLQLSTLADLGTDPCRFLTPQNCCDGSICLALQLSCASRGLVVHSHRLFRGWPRGLEDTVLSAAAAAALGHGLGFHLSHFTAILGVMYQEKVIKTSKNF